MIRVPAMLLAVPSQGTWEGLVCGLGFKVSGLRFSRLAYYGLKDLTQNRVLGYIILYL